jgi:hypothetical protein
MPRANGLQRPNAGLLLGAAGLVGLAVAVARVPILTPDVWWHLATGRTIATNGLPTADPFSYTLTGQHWLVHEWLADRILWALYARAGLIGLVWWRAAWIAAATCVSYALARRGASTWIAVPLVVCAAFALQRNWIDRPQLWTFVLLPAVVLVLEASRTGARRAVWSLPPVFALWVNVHGGFMLGLVAVVAWHAGIAWESRRRAGGGW